MQKYLLVSLFYFLILFEASAAITDIHDKLSPCTGKLVDNEKGKKVTCKGKVKEEFYYNVERSSKLMYTFLQPAPSEKKVPVYSPCNGLVYAVNGSGETQNVYIRCENNNIIVAVYYLDSLIKADQINKPITWEQQIGYVGTQKNGQKVIVLEMLDIGTREYVNPEQILSPEKFKLKHPANGIKFPFRGEAVKIYTMHDDKTDFNDSYSEYAGLYPSYYGINKGEFEKFYTPIKKGGYIMAMITGTVTKIENMSKDGKLKYVELENKERQILVRIYYCDSDILHVKVGDEVTQGSIIGKFGVDRQ